MNLPYLAGKSPSRIGVLGLFLFVATIGLGCRREQIETYQIAKGAEYTAPLSAAAEVTTGIPIRYTLPRGWVEETPTGASLAQFSLANNTAELSVLSFPGSGPTQLNIVNIVRQKAGLPPLQEEQLAQLVQPVDIGGAPGTLINLSGATDSETNKATSSVMVAMTPRDDGTWFFKMSGPAEVIANQKPALVEFLKSVSFVEGTSQKTTLPPMASENANSSDTATPFDSSTTPGLPTWIVPKNWKQVAPTQMLLAKFSIANEQGNADVTVSSFPGTVGGVLGNVNRWRKSVGLPEAMATDLDKLISSIDVADGQATLVDMTGAGKTGGKNTELIGVIWPRGEQTWFYKLMGDAAAVGAEKPAFIKFVQSVR